MIQLHDPACADLARHFLGAEAEAQTVAELASRIQSEIESWFRYEGPGLSHDEKAAQGRRCSCRGFDDYCVCQNVPDATTRAERKEATRCAP